MKRGTITINSTSVTVIGNVWMTDYEIAELFGVTFSTVLSNIKSIYKSGALYESDTYQYIHLENGNRADAYNMEMVTAIAFHLNSMPAKVFRTWVVKMAVAPTCSPLPIIVCIKNTHIC